MWFTTSEWLQQCLDLSIWKVNTSHTWGMGWCIEAASLDSSKTSSDASKLPSICNYRVTVNWNELNWTALSSRHCALFIIFFAVGTADRHKLGCFASRCQCNGKHKRTTNVFEMQMEDQQSFYVATILRWEFCLVLCDHKRTTINKDFSEKYLLSVLFIIKIKSFKITHHKKKCFCLMGVKWNPCHAGYFWVSNMTKVH